MDERKKPVIIIEHLEQEMGIWILLEYRHSSLIYGKDYLWLTNIPTKYHRIFSKYALRVYSESLLDLVRKSIVRSDEILVLDPQAEEELTYGDLLEFKYIVIGGILGDHPPRGRTKKLLTDKLGNVEARNIGDGQYSIDGAVYYVDYLWKNRNLKGFKYVDGVVIEAVDSEIRLPFRYPVVNGKPLLAPGLIEYLSTGKTPDYILRELGLTK
ncbi:MAG: RNA methyltransferase [Thermoprotei archaeon]